MKRILLIIISILLMFSFVACGVAGKQGQQGEQGLQGEVGNDGLSAFEIFKKYYPEYTGTEEEWIYATATNNVCALFGHKVVIDEALEAMCTVNGLTEGSHCEVCKEVLIQQEVIEAKHNYAEGICSKCGDNNLTNNLVFTLSDDGECYYVSDYTGNDTELVIPSTYNGKLVTDIKRGAFEGCASLTKVWIPDSVISIDYYAFGGCSSLTSVTIGKGLTSIGNTAFTGCDSLVSIIVSSENQVYDSRNNCNAIIETANNKLIIGCNNTIIPSDVTTIGDWAFLQCGFTSIVIPKSIVAINYGAFTDCYDLTEVYYEGSEKQWKEININNSLDGNSWLINATLTCAGTDDDSGFIYESNGDGTSSIVGIGTTIEIPSESPDGKVINRIASYAFSNLKNLIIEMPSTILTIDDYAFYDCDIKEIIYSGSVEEWNNIIKTDGCWNANCSGFTVICSDGEITY